MRYVTLTMDHPALFFKLKEKMNKFIRSGDELNAVFRQYIKGDPYHEDPEESMDVEADRLFELVNATAPLSTDEQWIKAISSVKAISGLRQTDN